MGTPQTYHELEPNLPALAIPMPVHTRTTEDLYVIGVTGTNGKTTVTHLIGEVLRAAGFKPFVLGTLNSGNRDLSTPLAGDIARIMQAHLEQGGTHLIMEVTSEGIDQDRVHNVDFDIKLLTNITQDHLDYHKTFKNYQDTKLGFMAEGLAHKIYPGDFCDVRVDFTTKLLGDFNHLNIQAAVSVLRYMETPEVHIRNTLSACVGPIGRMEIIDHGQPFMVVVDYAHTPDGLENVLRTARDIADRRGGRLLVMFGCGGERDRGKRPQMGKIASGFSDLLVITDDNPRHEDARLIRDEIFSGVTPELKECVLMQNRRTAIKFMIRNAHKHDVLILAGKGHETLQINKSEEVHFDDREEAAIAIRGQMKSKSRRVKC